MATWSSCLCLMLLAQVSSAQEVIPIRKPAVSGMFYPSDPIELRQKVQRYLTNATVDEIPGRILAAIVPHAGYDYSAPVGAHAFRAVQGRPFETVVIVSPSHRVAFDGISIYPRGAYETPLGLVPIDEEMVKTILHAMLDEQERQKTVDPESWDRRLGLGYYAPAHQQEHGVEVELPFLQEVLPGAKIVPMVVGAQNSITVARLTRMMIQLMQRPEILFLFSVDLSHYHSYEEAVRLDTAGLEAVTQLDAVEFIDRYNEGKTEVDCPVGIAALLQATDSLNAEGTLLKYANSGDVTGDKSRVVGYSAVCIHQPPRPPDEDWLDEGEKEELLRIAKETLQQQIAGDTDVLEERTIQHEERTIQHERLKKPGMAFVTLEKHGKLRGCIGYTQPYWPLHETVMRGAIAAATQDPRFPAVQRDELDDVEIEISVLTPLHELKDWHDITIGLHGLHIKKGGRRGLLLPQVAADYGWTRIQFLEQVCRKAGLPTDAWKSGAKLSTFTAQVFH